MALRRANLSPPQFPHMCSPGGGDSGSATVCLYAKDSVHAKVLALLRNLASDDHRRQYPQTFFVGRFRWRRIVARRFHCSATYTAVWNLAPLGGRAAYRNSPELLFSLRHMQFLHRNCPTRVTPGDRRGKCQDLCLSIITIPYGSRSSYRIIDGESTKAANAAGFKQEATLRINGRQIAPFLGVS